MGGGMIGTEIILERLGIATKEIVRLRCALGHIESLRMIDSAHTALVMRGMAHRAIAGEDVMGGDPR